MYDPDLDLALSMHATSKLKADREVMLTGKSTYWRLRNQLKLFGLDLSPGGVRVSGLLSDQAEAASFAKADVLDRVAPLVAGSAIKFTYVGVPGTAMADAGRPPDPGVIPPP